MGVDGRFEGERCVYCAGESVSSIFGSLCCDYEVRIAVLSFTPVQVRKFLRGRGDRGNRVSDGVGLELHIYLKGNHRTR